MRVSLKTQIGVRVSIKTQNTRGVGRSPSWGEACSSFSGTYGSANPWSRVSGIWGMNKFCCWKPFHLWCLLWSTTQIPCNQELWELGKLPRRFWCTLKFEGFPPLPILVLSKNSPGMFKEKIKIKTTKPPRLLAFLPSSYRTLFSPCTHTNYIEPNLTDIFLNKFWILGARLSWDGPSDFHLESNWFSSKESPL